MKGNTLKASLALTSFLLSAALLRADFPVYADNCGPAGGSYPPPEGYANPSKEMALDFTAGGGKTKFDENLSISSGDHFLPSVHKGCRAEKDVWLSPSNNYGFYRQEGHALGIKIAATSKDGPPALLANPDVDHDSDKMMWSVRNKHNGGIITFGEEVYFAFALKLPDDFQAPDVENKNFMLYQIWQGSPFPPPVSLHIVKGADGGPLLELRDRKSVRDPTFTILGDRVPLVRGQWYEFILGAKPSRTGDGYTSLWQREGGWFTRIAHASNVNVGYNTDCEDRKGVWTCPNDELNSSFGLYRNRQALPAKIFFDEVRGGSTFDSVILDAPMDGPSAVPVRTDHELLEYRVASDGSGDFQTLAAAQTAIDADLAQRRVQPDFASRRFRVRVTASGTFHDQTFDWRHSDRNISLELTSGLDGRAEFIGKEPCASSPCGETGKTFFTAAAMGLTNTGFGPILIEGLTARNYWRAVDIMGDRGRPVDHVVIRDNVLQGFGGLHTNPSGVGSAEVIRLKNVRHSRVTHNVLKDAANQDAYSPQDPRYTFHGIRLERSARNVIAHNSMENIVGTAVLLTGESQGNRVEGNAFVRGAGGDRPVAVSDDGTGSAANILTGNIYAGGFASVDAPGGQAPPETVAWRAEPAAVPQERCLNGGLQCEVHVWSGAAPEGGNGTEADPFGSLARAKSKIDAFLGYDAASNTYARAAELGEGKPSIDVRVIVSGRFQGQEFDWRHPHRNIRFEMTAGPSGEAEFTGQGHPCFGQAVEGCKVRCFTDPLDDGVWEVLTVGSAPVTPDTPTPSGALCRDPRPLGPTFFSAPGDSSDFSSRNRFSGYGPIKLSGLALNDYFQGFYLEGRSAKVKKGLPATPLQGALVSGNSFERIGNIANPAWTDAFAAVKADLVSRAVFRHNAFTDVANTRGNPPTLAQWYDGTFPGDFEDFEEAVDGPRLLHAFYLSHDSTDNLFEGNIFSGLSGADIKFRDASHRNFVRGNVFQPSTWTTRPYPFLSHYQLAGERPSFMNVFTGNRFVGGLKWDLRDQPAPEDFQVLRCAKNASSALIHVQTLAEADAQAGFPVHGSRFGLVFLNNVTDPVADPDDASAAAFYCDPASSSPAEPKDMPAPQGADQDPRLPIQGGE